MTRTRANELRPPDGVARWRKRRRAPTTRQIRSLRRAPGLKRAFAVGGPASAAPIRTRVKSTRASEILRGGAEFGENADAGPIPVRPSPGSVNGASITRPVRGRVCGASGDSVTARFRVNFTTLSSTFAFGTYDDLRRGRPGTLDTVVVARSSHSTACR